MSRHIVIEGNLTRDPNGGYGKDTGKAYTHLDIAVTDRTRNNQGDWVDGPPTYYRVTVFGRTAENALNSLAKGNTVLVLQGVIFNYRTVSAGHGRSRIVWRAELTAPRAGAIGSVLAGTPRRRRAPDNWAAKRCTRDSLDSGTAHGSDSTKPISRNIE
jgi:single-stranded DNA-binding protein